jgi:CRISPR-associated endoribonuclease Cas6
VQLTLVLGAAGPVSLSVHYAGLVQGLLYRVMENPALKSYLHEQGFAYENRRFKLFTFSRLMSGVVRYDRNTGNLLLKPPLYLVICSPVSFILQEIGTGLLRRGWLRLGPARLEVREMYIAALRVAQSTVRVRMLSPLVVYSTLLTASGRKFTYYYSPFEPRFSELVRENLAKKHALIHGRPALADGFAIRPVGVTEKDHKITRYKDTIIKGWMGEYELAGDPDLLQVALDAGLGSKNSQGHGCCTLVQRGGKDPF